MSRRYKRRARIDGRRPTPSQAKRVVDHTAAAHRRSGSLRYARTSPRRGDVAAAPATSASRLIRMQGGRQTMGLAWACGPGLALPGGAGGRARRSDPGLNASRAAPDPTVAGERTVRHLRGTAQLSRTPAGPLWPKRCRIGVLPTRPTARTFGGNVEAVMRASPCVTTARRSGGSGTPTTPTPGTPPHDRRHRGSGAGGARGSSVTMVAPLCGTRKPAPGHGVAGGDVVRPER
jgi:hypothetical protein